MKLEFPKGFLWGAATSAHQVEGNNHNDWTEWELKNAPRLSSESGGKYSPENYISGRACDHYKRFREDFDIAKSLGHNVHRFSIEWSRVEPEEGKWDEKEIEHYREVISALRERGIEPFVTLYHWTLPIWVRDHGGWKNQKTIVDFARYAEKMTASLQGVKYYMILNEPLVYAKLSFSYGKWPPQHRGNISYFRVTRNLISAHKAAYSAIKKNDNSALVGIAHNMSYFRPHQNTLINRLLARLGAWQKNFYFLNAIKNHTDFIGFNYYTQYIVNFGFAKEKTADLTDMGWGISPEGIYHTLKDLKKYNKPVYITENGLADAKDALRKKFIREHLKWAHKAISEGVDLKGYFYWSLLDNFEWSDGFQPRFGLVEIDYKTMERNIRQSAYTYATIAKENSLEV